MFQLFWFWSNKYLIWLVNEMGYNKNQCKLNLKSEGILLKINNNEMNFFERVYVVIMNCFLSFGQGMRLV